MNTQEPMTPERWAQIKSVFYSAAELPTADRSEYIRSRCGGDGALAAEIEELVAAGDQAPSFIESPAFQGARPEDHDGEAGKMIGPYRVVRKIGAGGMGSVYLAERADRQFDKRVAIKLIRQGLGEEVTIHRFVAERQMLARLEHANIARLIDGGTTENGLPYLVMEYVEGKPITEYCDQMSLPIGERLALFRMVCEAVHHAHQNLIVHRDIKPGNILVTARGEPKLLDFGIAKLLTPEGELDNVTTIFSRMMTPDYASPEQARGEPITTASDIYSLGVLLYELLTGVRPYQITSSSPLEIAQVICEREPVKPSTAVGAPPLNTPGTPVRSAAQLSKLRRQLKGDLDNIVLKAMSKEPGRRYSSAQEFSEDMRRRLEGLPVNARAGSVGYRAGKFARRHKAVVSASAIILVLLVAGSAGIARQAMIARRERARAEKRFNDVRNLATDSMFKFHDSIARLPGATDARKLLVSEALQYLNSLVNDASDDPSLQSELATAYFRLGEIQGVSTNGNLGDYQGALESHRKALELRQTLAKSNPRDPDLQILLADSYQRVGSLLDQTGHKEAGIESLNKSVGISESLLASGTGGSPAQRSLAFAQHGLAQIIAGRDHSAALDYYKRSMATHEAILAEDPTDVTIRRNLSLLYKNAGAVLHADHDKDGALVLYYKALAMDEADLAADPDDAAVRMALSFSYGSIGSALMDKRDLQPALGFYRKALDLRLSVAQADPKNAFARDSVARAYDRIGRILLKTGDSSGSSASYEKMFETSASSGPLPIQAAVQAKMADTSVDFADDADSPQSKRGYLRQAARWYRGALDLLSHDESPLSDAQSKEKDKIAQKLARCEAALKSAK